MSDITTLMMAAAGAGGEEAGYQISRSLRFNSADSAYLNRTFGTATSVTIWTFSAWVKRGALGGTRQLFGASTNTSFGFNSSDQLNLTLNGSSAATSTAVFRDPSAWYHIVYQQNGSAQTIYVNNTSVATGTTAAAIFNTGISHQIGAANTTNYFNGYLTEINFVDGQALTPSDFGETDATTGVWKPKEYTGTYGTNGFHLDFSDNTSTTTLGYDAAGSNDWTLNNFSVTAGAGNDSLVDTPTPYGTDTGAGGEVRGNYCTLNPLDFNSTSFPCSNGNLTWTTTTTATGSVRATIGMTSGKWYWEVLADSVGAGGAGVGIGKDGSTDFGSGQALYQANNGNQWIDGVSTAYGASWATSDLIGIAYDADAGEITFYKNNSSQGTITLSGYAGVNVCPVLADGSSLAFTLTANFGQRPFAYTAPSGFKALCTQNLPDPTVVQGDDYFNTVLYTGTGSSQSITGVGFQPDWVWIKERSGAADHGLYDAVRGVQNQLESNTTTAETTESTGLTAFGSDGFTVGSLAQLNTNTDTYVAWNWNAGGSNATNTDGTITSTVRANTTAGFSIVSYTGTGSAATVGHGLGAAPAMIIVKNRDQADAWQVYHKANTAAPETDYLVLNTTAATADAADRWNDTAPTSTVFSIGNGVEVNTNTEDYIAYCFAPISGFSAMSAYTGNGSSNGPFVYTGFRPAFVMIKRTDSSTGADWFMWDATRNTFNVVGSALFADLNNAEIAYTALDFLSNGFKLRSSDVSWNGSSATYIFMAFGDPFKYSLAR